MFPIHRWNACPWTQFYSHMVDANEDTELTPRSIDLSAFADDKDRLPNARELTVFVEAARLRPRAVLKDDHASLKEISAILRLVDFCVHYNDDALREVNSSALSLLDARKRMYRRILDLHKSRLEQARERAVAERYAGARMHESGGRTTAAARMTDRQLARYQL